MSIKRRRQEPNLTYHIFSRCMNKSFLMKSEKAKELMLLVLTMALYKFDFQLCNYIIMDNHIHLIIKTVEGGADISRIMQFIKSQYARRYNKMMNRVGPFWNERYGDRIIEESDNPQFAYFTLIHYIDNNSVKANYVSNSKNYRFGSTNYLIDENYSPPVKLSYHEYFLNLGSTFKERVKKFLEFEKTYKEHVFAFAFQI